MKHRMFALVFCTALAVLALTIPAGAEAVTGTCGEGIEWTYEDGTLTVSGSGPMENFEAAAPWDDYRGEITKAVISDGVTTVGDNAFRDYDALQEVSIGNDVTTLGKGSFLGCDALVRIHLPSSFRVFDEECLRDCKSLTAIHCEGTFPSFRLNCLWGSSVKIYYPASRPWPVKLVQELEETFGGRIEFLDSDGNDPYTPEDPTQADTETATVCTTEPVTEPAVQPPDGAGNSARYRAGDGAHYGAGGNHPGSNGSILPLSHADGAPGGGSAPAFRSGGGTGPHRSGAVRGGRGHAGVPQNPKGRKIRSVSRLLHTFLILPGELP